MIKEHFLTISDREAWQKYAPERRSVFGSLGYARICQAHRGFSPRLYVVESDEAVISYALLLRSLAASPFAQGTRAKWDTVTPDFTGPVSVGESPLLAAAFPALRNSRFEREGIVAEFAHLHPWSQARAILQDGCELNRDIVWVDTSLDPEDLWRDQLKLQCRQKIKQAERLGVRVITASSDDHIREYHRIYSHTMNRNGAGKGYYFSYEFFRAFREELPENSRFFLAEFGGQIVAGTLCLYDETDAFYFLTGTDARFQHVRPTNLLVWELIRWAHSAGKKRLTLGAGNYPDDGLYRFKSSFSHARQPFYVYKRVHLQQDYAIMERRFRESAGLYDDTIGYFPVYRYSPPAAAQASQAESSGEVEVRASGGARMGVQKEENSQARDGRVFAPWPCFADDEIEAAATVLQSGRVNYWTGEEGHLFEREFAEFTQCRHAVAVANGTVALELALRGLEIGPGDEVITTSRTFIATASSVVAVGARPVFADVDRDSQNITAETIRAALTPATRAIIVVNLAGWSCEMDEILELADQYQLKVIEDCAQAQGATYGGRPVGSFGDVAAFSFCQDKNMTSAGEGGMVVTNSGLLWSRMWSYKDHGKSYGKVFRQAHPFGFRWLHESFGTNWRLSEVQSAVGRMQLRKLPGWISRRRKLAALLRERLSLLPGLRVPSPSAHVGHAYYKFYVFVAPQELSAGWNRDRIAQAIAAQGVPCTTGSCSEIYLEEAFSPHMRPSQRLPVARELGENSLLFLVHPTLSEANMARTCEVAKQVMQNATRACLAPGVTKSATESRRTMAPLSGTSSPLRAYSPSPER